MVYFAHLARGEQCPHLMNVKSIKNRNEAFDRRSHLPMTIVGRSSNFSEAGLAGIKLIPPIFALIL
jgi:hypothetical protein